jgi:hypothetical protein
MELCGSRFRALFSRTSTCADECGRVSPVKVRLTGRIVHNLHSDIFTQLTGRTEVTCRKMRHLKRKQEMSINGPKNNRSRF